MLGYTFDLRAAGHGQAAQLDNSGALSWQVVIDHRNGPVGENRTG
jgi:hypothetical protein